MYKWFNQMWLNEETRIAQLLTSSSRATALHPSEGCGDEHLLIFEGRAEFTHRRYKSVPSGA